MKYVLYGVLGFIGLLIVGLMLNIISLPFKVANQAVNTASGVVERVINPDHALQTYRRFHGMNAAIIAKQGQIALAKTALEQADPDRREARRVELTGLQQNCLTLVSQYNADATRADTVIFMNPERYLPGSWTGDRSPLPLNINAAVCQ
jgi:hypothetical protein